MAKSLTPEEKRKRMMETPIPRLVISLSIPTVISMLVTALYNMADTYFIGLLGNPSATAGVGVCAPLMAILQAVGFMFGHGSGNFISRELGAQQQDRAEIMASIGFFSSLICGAVLALIGVIWIKPIATLLGSTETTVPYAVEYGFYIMLGAPWLVSSFVLNNQLRFQGNAVFGMVGIAAGAVLDVGLNPLFIFTFNMGVAGAALTTIVSQFVSFVLLLMGTRRGGTIRIRFRNFAPSLAYYKEIFRGGIPSLLRQGLASTATIALNYAAGVFGDVALAAMSIVSRVVMFSSSAVVGFGQGFQPICGFNYGAKRYDRVREAFWYAVRLSTGILLAAAVAGAVFAPQIVEVFLGGFPEVTAIGALSIRLQCIMLPFSGFMIISNMMLQTMGMAREASLAAVARQGLFFIPAVLLLPLIWGLLGVQLSQAVSDLCSLLLIAPLTLRVLANLKREEAGLTHTNEPDESYVPV